MAAERFRARTLQRSTGLRPIWGDISRKNVVASGLAYRCEVQIAYAIRSCGPGIGNGRHLRPPGAISDNKISQRIRNVFDLKPSGIIKTLDLLRPIYQKTRPAFGHFGRNDGDFSGKKQIRRTC